MDGAHDNGPRYIIKPGAEPTNVRIGPDGELRGEVPVMMVQSCGDVAHTWSPKERTFVPQVPDDLPSRRLKPDPLKATTAAEFVDTMRRYRRWAGSPSFREMADRIGVRSPSRFCEALNSDRLPSYTLLNAFIVSLHGSDSSAEFQRWAAAWRELTEREREHSHASAGRVPPPRY